MMRLLVGLILVGSPGVVTAQGTSDFTIQVFGSVDTQAPTVPAVSSVTPVAASQIDIQWAPATDNFLVAGYVVFRDGVAIATTTAVMFSDTGLSASTTYAYQVRAFDGLPNFSALSTAIATTTFQIVVPPVSTSTTPSRGATQARVVIDSFVLDEGTATATVSLTTRDMSRIELRLGITPTYELAYIVGNRFRRNHDIFINDLLPDTTYFYELVGYTPSGGQTVLRQGSFITGSDQPPSPPTNVSELTIEQQGTAVTLRYLLPADFPVDGVVRVVRNQLGFPQFLNDGLVVYEGVAEQVSDMTALEKSDRVFYTVFVIDPNGFVSSGAVAYMADNRIETGSDQPPSSATGGAVTPDNTPDDPSVSPTTPRATGEIPVGVAPEPVAGFPARGDFIVEQSDSRFSFSATTILLSSEDSFLISVPAAVVTGDFKTIVATLSDPRDPEKSFSFLLRLNGDQSNYSAVIAPLRTGGESVLVVEVFDYAVKVIGRYETTLTFLPPQATATSTVEVWYWRAQVWLWGLLLVIPFLVLAFVWFIFWKRDRDEDEDNITV